MKLPVACLGFALLWGCDGAERSAGTNDETHTEVAARIFAPGGAGFATGAAVQVVPIDSTQAVAVGAVDKDGHPVTGKVPDGIYSVSISLDGAVVVTDSVPAVGGRIALVRDDTLEPSGSLSGVVAVQPQDDPSTVVVQVLGTENYCNVSVDGRFTLTGLPTGRVRLRLATSLADYTPTFDTASSVSGQARSIRDTIRMVYTGIPVVTGLSGRSDPATGEVVLSWDPVRYSRLQDYLVFRDTAGAIGYGQVPFAATASTTWRDTSSDSTAVEQAWRYRVVARSRVGGANGDWFGAVTVVSVPPGLRRAESASWSALGVRGASPGAVDGKMAVASLSTGGTRRTIAVRSSADGLVWDSAGTEVAALELGQVLEWDLGIGAGKAWCLGRSSIGDGIRVVAYGGSAWSSSALDDSLWTGSGSRLLGSPGRIALVGPGGSPAMAWSSGDGNWHKVGVRGRVLGVADSGVFTDGGGSHLLLVSWDDPSRVVRDLGVPPEQASSMVEWAGRPCFVGAHGLWVLDPDGWALRRSPSPSVVAGSGSSLLLLDTAGSLWKGILE